MNYLIKGKTKWSSPTVVEGFSLDNCYFRYVNMYSYFVFTQ